MKKLCIASNMLNERPQIEGWLETVMPIADGGILVVDGGSTDGTIEALQGHGVTVVVDNIIQSEGYGPAREHLREMTRKHFPGAHWMMFLDGDERIDPADHHNLRFLKDYLIETFDAIAFPRIDWMDTERTSAAKDWHVYPDYQARMTRINSPLRYVRRLHEQIIGSRGVFAQVTNPKIHHFHRSVEPGKRDFIGKLCAMLHAKDDEWGHTYPEHPKEAFYRRKLKEDGL